jgi:hypothetical protein
MSESVEKWIASVWAEVASELERRKTQLYEQIKNYPPPITACDQQFDYLLAQHREISRELDRMRAVVQASSTNHEPARVIDEFLRSATSIDDEARQRIRSRLSQAVPEPDA